MFKNTLWTLFTSINNSNNIVSPETWVVIEVNDDIDVDINGNIISEKVKNLLKANNIKKLAKFKILQKLKLIKPIEWVLLPLKLK